MPQLTRSVFVLAVPSLARTGDYYSRVLGFTVRPLAPGWSWLERDAVAIMAGECPDALPPGDLGDHSYFAYLHVDDVDGYFASVEKAGGQVTKRLRDEPWGMREFGLRTVDGHRIMFGAPIGKPPAT